MNKNHASDLAKSFTTPWTLRAYDALPGNAVWVGAGFTFVLLTAFFAGRFLIQGADNATQDDMRVAIIHILLTGYSASAYAYLLTTARKATQDLAPVVGHYPQRSMALDLAGKFRWWVMPFVGAASYLVIGVATTNATTPAGENPWHWQSWSYDLYWHRATTVLFVGWIGCLCHALVIESVRLSRLSDRVESLDLLELRPYQPLIRQGLTNAALVIGCVSIMSLFLVEARYGPVLLGLWVMFVLLAWIGLMLPLSGIRRKIAVAKNKELNWCTESMKGARDELRSGASGQTRIAELLAYQRMIENIRNWPFDHPTLVRFSLYIMIPLGSWVGGALIERGLDTFLS